jgi:isopenicillin-N N-acyltransferase like protein
MKPVVATLAALVMLGSGIAQADASGYLTSIGEGETKIPVVVVRGTPYEMGKRQGELIREGATQFIHTLMERIQASDPERFSNANLDAAWQAIAPHTDPRFHEELQGLAEGLQLPLATLQRAHAVPVVADYACSSIAAWGGATKDGHLYQTRNLDWHMGLTAQDHPLIVVYKPDEGIPHVNITFAGYIGANTGLNAEGIVLSEMGDSPGDDYPFDLDGVHFTTLFRTVMYDAKSLDDAVQMFQSAPRIKKYHYVVGDGIAGAGESIGAVKMLAHAPHLTIWKDNDPRDELAPQVFREIVYQDEGRGAFGPLQKVYGKIGSDELIDIACQIPIKGGNVLDVVFDATALECWISYARGDVEAYQRPFVHLRLSDYLD